jgi:plasmid stabilization system protein ParE
MKFAVSVLDRAWSDADRMFEWIAARSPQGAVQWDRVFEEALVLLQTDADQHGFAPENANLEIKIRQRLFKTRRGRPYRLLYTIVGEDVTVLRVRGPGQAPLTAEDFSE